MNARFIVSLVAAILLLTLQNATATTIHVPDDHATIQGGINAAAAGDTVVVACGTYYEHDIIMRSGVCLTSETGQPDCVTIDALRLGRVFYYKEVEGPELRGFTITGGGFPSIGGGIMCLASTSAVFRNCRVHGNEMGAVFCQGCSFLRFVDCSFYDNDHGVSCSSCLWCTFQDCTFEGNQDGGMTFGSGVVTLERCTFRGNSGESGAGLHCGGSSDLSLIDCLFVGNEALEYGGGICCEDDAHMDFTRCTIAGNSAGIEGGGICVATISGQPYLTLDACIIAFSGQGEGVSCFSYTPPQMTCCDIYGNDGGDWVGWIADQYGVNGNFAADPLFCGALNPDRPYTLHEDSPCVFPEAGLCGERIGAFGVGCGPFSPVLQTSWGAIKSLYQ